MQSITTLEISELFNKRHPSVTKAIDDLIKDDRLASDLFTEMPYTTQRNKTYRGYSMGVEGFCVFSDTWGYSRGKNAPVKAAILDRFGKDFVVVGSSRTRGEDDFYEMLKKIFSNMTIVREFPICGFLIDFYIKEVELFIEFDEEQHFSKQARINDANRWEAISDYMIEEFDDKASLIRVDRYKELEGIGAIAGFIALNTLNASGITSLYEVNQ